MVKLGGGWEGGYEVKEGGSEERKSYSDETERNGIAEEKE